jgi:hypothetical protein
MRSGPSEERRGTLWGYFAESEVRMDAGRRAGRLRPGLAPIPDPAHS